MLSPKPLQSLPSDPMDDSDDIDFQPRHRPRKRKAECAARDRDRCRSGDSVGTLVERATGLCASGQQAVRCMESRRAAAELGYVLSKTREHPVLACILARLSVGETIVGADGKENTRPLPAPDQGFGPLPAPDQGVGVVEPLSESLAINSDSPAERSLDC